MYAHSCTHRHTHTQSALMYAYAHIHTYIYTYSLDLSDFKTSGFEELAMKLVLLISLLSWLCLFHSSVVSVYFTPQLALSPKRPENVKQQRNEPRGVEKKFLAGSHDIKPLSSVQNYAPKSPDSSNFDESWPDSERPSSPRSVLPVSLKEICLMIMCW